MDISTIITLIFLYSAAFMAGWGIILILLWIRPEYMFLLFYVVANHILVFLFQLISADPLAYLINHAIVAVGEIITGVPIVALFKWLKTRKSGAEKRAEEEIERVRAEIAVRDTQTPAAQ